MENTPVSNTSGGGLVVVAFVFAVIACLCAIAVLILSIVNFDITVKQIFWWVTFGLMVVGLIISMFASKRAGNRRLLSLITSFIGLATAVILIISLFVKF